MKRAWNKTKSIMRDISQLQISVFSANAAFFILLSLFPAAITLLSALQYLPATVSDLEGFLETIAPPPVYTLLSDFALRLHTVGSVTVLSVSAVGTVWSITRATVSIMNGLDVVYRSHGSRTLLRKWGISLFCALLFFVSILATLLLQVFGSSVYDMAVGAGWKHADVVFSVLQLRWPFTIGFLILVFCLFYTVLPRRRLRFSQNVPGAVLAALGWIVYSALFGFYVENFSNYANVYGSLTAVVITMLWMYFCMNLIFYGGLFNYILAEVPHPLKQLRNYYHSQEQEALCSEPFLRICPV